MSHTIFIGCRSAAGGQGVPIYDGTAIYIRDMGILSKFCEGVGYNTCDKRTMRGCFGVDRIKK